MDGVDLYVLVVIGLATGVLTGLTGASGMSILISTLLLAGAEIRQVIGLTFVVTLSIPPSRSAPTGNTGTWTRNRVFWWRHPPLWPS